MYFPYLRGKQYELLAVRELVEKDLLSKKVIPVIEPIKLTPTLVKTVKVFIKKEREIAIIHNPQVGDFKGELVNGSEELADILDNKYIIIAHLLNGNSRNELNSTLKKDRLLLINTNADNLDIYVEKFSDKDPRYCLIRNDLTLKQTVKNNRVLLDDKFPKKERNVDYLDNPDNYFSGDHINFHNDGYLGYSDYSIVGNKFTESGFSPMAVAIHIVYFDKHENLRVNHFVSDSNKDTSDTPGKFYEALEKLMNWQSKVNVKSHAMDIFKKHYVDGSYPNLGPVKKLSIMHHLELISRYFDRKQES